MGAWEGEMGAWELPLAGRSWHRTRRGTDTQDHIEGPPAGQSEVGVTQVVVSLHRGRAW